MKKLLSLILALSMVMALIPTAFAADGDATTVTYTYNLYNSSWLERGNPVAQKRIFQTAADYYHSLTTESLEDLEWEYIGSSVSSSYPIATSDNAGKTNYNMVTGNHNSNRAARAMATNADEWIAFKVEVPVTAKYTVDVNSFLYNTATTDMDVYLIPANAEVSVGGYSGELVGAFADSRVYGTYEEVQTEINGATKHICIREGAKKLSDFSFEAIVPEDYKAIDSASLYHSQTIGNSNKDTTHSISSNAKKLSLTAGVYVLLLNANTPGEINISSLSLTAEPTTDEPVVPDEPEDPIVPEVSYNATVPVTYTLAYDGWFERINSTTKKWQRSKTAFSDSTDPNDAWAYIGTSTGVSYGNSLTFVAGNYSDGATRVKIDAVKGWIAFQIKVPETGIYKVTEVESFLNKESTSDMDMYILPADAQVTVNEFTGTLLGAFDDERVYGTFDTESASLSRSGAQTFEKFTFTALDKDEYKVVDGANLYKNVTLGNATCEKVPFTAGREVVLTADTPYVLLFCTNEADKELNIHSVTLAPVTELSGSVAFGAGADIIVNGGEYKAGNIISFTPGTSVTVEVTDTENFAGWVRGTEDSGAWVSGEPRYIFNIMSPTYLTPVYTTPDESATHSVEFWDENGAYVETITAPGGKASLPNPEEEKYGLVGGSFIGWFIDEVTELIAGAEVSEGITRAVARYNYGTFGEKHPYSDDSAKYWKRGDDIVAYGNTYNFYLWNGEEDITFGTEEVVKNPLVVLDSTPVDGAYMIEYDKGNALEIVEAGIIFGSTADIHIGSTDGSKAASQRNGVDDGINDGHGQFCAKPNTNGNSDYVRGYLIYKGDDNKLYVIYTAAVSTSAQ